MAGLKGVKLSEATIATMRKRLVNYAHPKLGRLEVQSIDADVLADLLRPIWTSKPQTAQRVRQAVIRVLRFSRPDGHLLEGAMAKAVSDRLPKQPDGQHHAAMPHAELPAFMTRLAAKDTKGALALRFTILTAVRSGEARGALWREIDREAGVWEIPATRMKMRKPHRVPLSKPILAVLNRVEHHRRAGCDLIFPSDAQTPLSDMTLTKVLRDMKLKYRVHGFRSTFADWRAGETDYPEEIAEAALAHEVPDDVKRAYRRTDFFDKRRALMADWGQFCAGHVDLTTPQQSARPPKKVAVKPPARRGRPRKIAEGQA